MASHKESPTKKQKTEQSNKMTAAPDQFEGFLVEDEKTWDTFKKMKVRVMSLH